MAETIYWLATLLWSLVVLLALIVFRRPLGRFIRSAGNRDLLVRIADQDLSVTEISRQHADLVNDLQDQVSALRQRVAELEAARWQPNAEPSSADTGLVVPVEPWPSPDLMASVSIQSAPTVANELAELSGPMPEAESRQLPLPVAPPPWERLEAIATEAPVPPPLEPPSGVGVERSTPAPMDLELSANPVDATSHSVAPTSPLGGSMAPRPTPTGVLWVDDHPEHNAVQLDLLQRHQVLVHTAHSTEEALESLRRRRYEIVVSGMTREENGKSIPNAGLELVRAIRLLDQETPIAIYAASHHAGMYGPMARDAGANLLTGSWFELAEELRTRQLFSVRAAGAGARKNR